jgi:hypothetical protein
MIKVECTKEQLQKAWEETEKKVRSGEISLELKVIKKGKGKG